MWSTLRIWYLFEVCKQKKLIKIFYNKNMYFQDKTKHNWFIVALILSNILIYVTMLGFNILASFPINSTTSKIRIKWIKFIFKFPDFLNKRIISNWSRRNITRLFYWCDSSFLGIFSSMVNYFCMECFVANLRIYKSISSS